MFIVPYPFIKYSIPIKQRKMLTKFRIFRTASDSNVPVFRITGLLSVAMVKFQASIEQISNIYRHPNTKKRKRSMEFENSAIGRMILTVRTQNRGAQGWCAGAYYFHSIKRQFKQGKQAYISRSPELRISDVLQECFIARNCTVSKVSNYANLLLVFMTIKKGRRLPQERNL